MRAFAAVPSGMRAALVVAGTSLFMVLVAWATLIGPDEVFTGPGPTPSTVTTTPPPPTCLPTPQPGAAPPDNPDNLPWCEPSQRQQAEDLVREFEPPLWVKLIAWTFQLVLFAVLAFLVAWALSRAVRQLLHRTAQRTERETVDFVTLSDSQRLVQEMVEDGELQERMLREGEPRNAVVEAWLRFEVQGARAGVPRESWETSSEYAIRILDVVSADSAAATELAALYREARFSDHPITEEHRAAALAALASIRRSLGVPA